MLKEQAVQDLNKQKEVNVIIEPVKKIISDEKQVLGVGSGGTVVFDGTLNGRQVAVKRMLLQHNHIANLEIQFLQRVDLHPNLITYYDKEEDRDFVYLAIEKCEGNLENLIDLMKAVKKGPSSNEWHNLPLAQLYRHTPRQLNTPDFMTKLMEQSL